MPFPRVEAPPLKQCPSFAKQSVGLSCILQYMGGLFGKTFLFFSACYQKAADVCQKDVWDFQVCSQTFFELRFSLGNAGKDGKNLNSQTWPGTPRRPSSRHPRPSYVTFLCFISLHVWFPTVAEQYRYAAMKRDSKPRDKKKVVLTYIAIPVPKVLLTLKRINWMSHV